MESTEVHTRTESENVPQQQYENYTPNKVVLKNVSEEVSILERTNIEKFVSEMYDSKLFPNKVSNKNQAILTLLKGKELGFTYFQSIQFLDVIQNQVTINAAGCRFLLRKFNIEIMLIKDFETVKISDDNRDAITEIHFYDKNSILKDEKGVPIPKKMTYCWSDAVRAGNVNKSTYKEYPKAMIRARCLSSGARFYFEDILCGLYFTDELDSTGEIYYDEDGNTKLLSK